jgi:hypothetical protein
MTNENKHLRVAANTDGAVILDTKLGKIAALNPTGAYVWQALERGESIQTMATNLARETGEQAETLGRDIREFIDSLREQQLLS